MPQHLLTILLFFCSLVTSPLIGQGRLFTPDTLHNFGIVTEGNGVVEHPFTVKNTGRRALIIKSVESDCGCTVAALDTNFIAPGEEKRLVVSFNPENRPGRFQKKVTLIAENEPKPVTFHIQGKVIPENFNPSRAYPARQGNLKTKYNSFYFGKVFNDQVVSKVFGIYNSGNKPITLKLLSSPAVAAVSLSANILKPGEAGTIAINFNAPELNQLGYYTDTIQIETSDMPQAIKQYTLVATIVPRLAAVKKDQLNDAPRLVTSKDEHNFGIVEKDDEATASFILSNEGRENLEILGVEVNCSCLATRLNKRVIKPGKRQEMKLTFTGANRNRREIKQVNIFTNDPLQPVKQLTIRAYVK